MRGPRTGAVLALFILLTVAHTWPLSAALSRAVLDLGDTAHHLWALNATAARLLEDPTRPLDGNIFYPHMSTLATLDHVLSSAVMALPLWALTHDPAFVYNVVLLLTFVLSGFFTYLLVRDLTGSNGAGLVAGCAFAFGTYRWTHLSHLHLISTQWLPLALWTLHRFLDRPTARRLGALTGAGLLLALTSWHLALLGSVGVALVAFWTMVADGRPVVRRIVGLAAAAALIGVVVWPVFDLQREYNELWALPETAGHTERVLQQHALAVEGLLAPSARVRTPVVAAMARRFGTGESYACPGVITLLLCAAALVPARGMRAHGRVLPLAIRAALETAMVLMVVGITAAAVRVPSVVERVGRLAPVLWLVAAALVAALWRAVAERGEPVRGEAPPGRTVLRSYIALAACGVVLAFGPQVEAGGFPLGSGLYRYDLWPILGLIRAPARFTLLLMVGAVVVAGFGALRVRRWLGPKHGAIALAGIVLAVNLESVAAPLTVVDLPPEPAYSRWLQENPEPGAVIEYPWVDTHWAALASLEHGRPIVNGFGQLRPPSRRFLWERDDFTDDQLQVLWEDLHPRFVVVRGSLYESHFPERWEAIRERIRRRPDALVPRARFGSDFIYELVDRGTGSRLVRRWPAERLEGSRGFEFAATLGGGRPGTVGVLAVSLDDRPLLRLEGDDARQPSTRFLSLAELPNGTGIRALVVEGFYRFDASAAANPIGTTNAAVAADVRIRSQTDRTVVEVNGRVYAADKGYLLLSLDPDGQVVAEGRFNTSWEEAESQRLADFVERLPGGAVVVVASEFDVSRRLTDAGVRAFRELGLTLDLRGRFGWGHAAVGVKGARPGSAIEDAQPGAVTITLGRPETRTVQIARLLLK